MAHDIKQNSPNGSSRSVRSGENLLEDFLDYARWVSRRPESWVTTLMSLTKIVSRKTMADE